MTSTSTNPPATEAWRPTRAQRPPRRNTFVYHPDLRILETLGRYCSWRGRTWCEIPIKRSPQRAGSIGLIELVLMFTKRNFSERSLFDHLGALVRDGWIRRHRQHRTGRDGSLELKPTHYVLTNRAWSWLKGLGVNVKKRFTASPKSLPPIALQYSAEMTVNPVSFTPYRAAQAPPKR
jgi:hypothetical protein